MSPCRCCPFCRLHVTMPRRGFLGSLTLPKNPGRYCIEAAQRGARAVGVEILPEAVVNARQRVKEGDQTHQLPRENLTYSSRITRYGLS
eukprot:scaffold660368_cov93-Prasinocladus_malaysianus.AAC.1